MIAPAVAGGFRRPSVRSRAQSKLQKAALETLESRKYLSAPWVADIQQTAGAYEGELTQLSMMLLDDDNPTDSDPIKTVGITWGDGTSDTFEFDTDFFSDSMFGHSYDDNAGPSTYPYHHIVITATDKQDEEVTFEHDLMVLNVNPWGSISNNGPANEGTPVTITANVSDSVGDTQAGLRYSFATSSGALATTYALAGTSAAGQLTFNENGTHTAYARAFDHDGGFSNFTTSVTVVNAAPVATLDVGDPALDGSVQVSFIEASDPSPTDTSTGLHYAFATDFNSLPTSYSAAGTATSHTYSTSEWNSSTTFWGRIFDRDNGYRTYSTSDVAPVSAAVASSSQINLTWTDEVENELGWRVQWSTDGANFDGYVNLSAGTDHFEATGLTEDTRYWFRVRAYDDATHPGATVYSPKVAQTTFLAAPTRVIAKADPGTGSGTITWKDNSGSEAEYVVLESSDGQTFDEIGSVSSDETSFDLTDLPESSQLIYRIRARKTGNTGDSILTPLVTLGENDLQVEDDFPKFEFSGVSGVKQRLVVKFNEDINGSLQSGDIHLDNLNTDQAVTITDSDWTYNSTTKTLTITFADEVNDPGSVGGPITGALADGNYQLRILAGDIAAAGVPLTNDIDHEFFFLNGDADHNRIVDVLDLVILNDNWFGTGKTFSQGDFNYDGAVNQWDLGIMSLKWQGTMPLPGVFNVFSSGPNQINLTWDDIAVGETGWRVQWSDDGTTFNTEDYINRPANSTHWEDETVPDGHRRWYRVRAYGTPNTPSDTIYSAKKGATTTILPPTAFTVAEAHADSIVLEWTPQSVYETGFLVQKSTDGVNYDQGAELGPGVTWYEVTDLDPETDYYFKITVHGEDADSMAVTSLSIRTQPAAPTLTSLDVNEAVLHPDAGGYASGELYFTPLTLTSGNGLVLERSVNGGDFVQLTPFDPINHQSGQIALWYYDIEGMSCAFRMYITDGSERISDYSNVLECTVAPNYPGYMSVNGDPTTSSVQLQWWDGSSHEDGYEVLVTPADGSEAWTISLAANTAGYTVTGLDEASAYDFKVRAVSSAGQSPWVADAIYGEVPHAIPVIATTKLAAPGGLDAAAANAVEVNLTWIDNSAFEDGSIIEYWATSGTGAHGLAYAPVNATGFPIMGLTPGTGYTFQVSAWRNNFAGGAGFVQSTVATDTATTSAVGSSTPPEDPPPPPVAEIDTHLYRWVFKGQVYSGYLHSSGQLQFTGSTSWTATPQPSALTAAIVEEYVSGSVTTIDPFPGDNIFDDPASHVYSFPADAGTTASDPFLITINSSTSATITFEDSIAWNYDTTHQEGTWTLNREDMLVGGDDPHVLAPNETPPTQAAQYVWISAADVQGSESPDSGQIAPGPITFKLGRWGSTSGSLAVQLFAAAGTAASSDFTTTILDQSDQVSVGAVQGLPSSVDIPSGDTFVTLLITPVDDDEFEETESVFAILKADAAYWLTTALMAQGQITDDDINLIAHRTGGNAGRAVRESIENSGDPSTFLILTNNDYEEGNTEGEVDFSNDQARIYDDAYLRDNRGRIIDDDLAKITLQSLYISGGLSQVSSGSVELVMSDEESARLFKSDGTQLSQRSFQITGGVADGSYLGTVLADDVDIWLEGLNANPDFVLSYILKDASGTQIAKDEVHIALVDWNFKNADDTNTPIIFSVPQQNFSEWLNDPPHSINPPAAAQIKSSIDGIAKDHISQLRYVPASGPSFVDTLNAVTNGAISDKFIILYHPDGSPALTPTQLNSLKTQKGWNVAPDSAGKFELSTQFDLQTHLYVQDVPDLKLNSFLNTYLTLSNAPETNQPMTFGRGLTRDSLLDAVLGRTWTETVDDQRVYDFQQQPLYVGFKNAMGEISEPVFNQVCVLFVRDPQNSGFFGATWWSDITESMVAQSVIKPVRDYLAGEGAAADTIRLLSPGEIYGLYKIVDAQREAEWEAAQRLPPSPTEVRIFGVLRILGAAGEVGGGSALAAIPSGVSQVAAVGVYVHAADTLWTGIQEIWTGEHQRSYTSHIVSGGAELVGVEHDTAILAGEFTDLGLGIIGSAGPLAVNKLRGLRSVAAMKSAGSAATVSGEIEATANAVRRLSAEAKVIYQQTIQYAQNATIETAANQAIFWTGGEAAKTRAMQIADGITFEQKLTESVAGQGLLGSWTEGSAFRTALSNEVAAGRITQAELDWLYRQPGYIGARRFAQDARGIVRVVNLQSNQNVLNNSTWLKIEFPVLMQNSKVEVIWANPPSLSIGQ